MTVIEELLKTINHQNNTISSILNVLEQMKGHEKVVQERILHIEAQIAEMKLLRGGGRL